MGTSSMGKIIYRIRKSFPEKAVLKLKLKRSVKISDRQKMVSIFHIK